MKKMVFGQDMYYDKLDTPTYLKGQVYEIDDKMITRWLKRGGEIVEDAPKVQAAKKENVEASAKKIEDKVKAVPQSKSLRNGHKK